MPQQFAQISDPHLSTLENVNRGDLLNKRALGYLSWRRKRRFEHRREVLDALQRDLHLDELAQVLVTGDLTHIGLPEEFRQARQWLEGLASPTQLALVPGNHDACVRDDWEQTYALWRDYMASDVPAATGGELFPSLRVRGDLAFIGLSTACPKPPLMATGTTDSGQLERLPDLLRETGQRGLFRVVYLHHCPLPGVEKWRKRLTNADDVSAILADEGAELVLHGHGHRAHQHVLATSDGDAPVIAVPSASALGLHGRDAAAYNRYRVTGQAGSWRLGIDRRAYDRQAGKFVDGGSSSLEIRRPRRPPSPGTP
jgi:3',5'-cyclic AMP phosphodiesterase CpdA